MNNAKERILEVMEELQQNNYQHIGEFKTICDAQLNKVISRKNYKFSAEWSEEDYRSEVISHVWDVRNKFDKNKGSFFAWFRKIAENIYYDYYEEKKKQIETVSMYILTENGEEVNLIDTQIVAFSCETEVLSGESCKRIWDKMSKLPENQRNAIELCRIQGYKPAEAAVIMKCKASDISRWLNRGVGKIEEYVREEATLTYSDRIA